MATVTLSRSKKAVLFLSGDGSVWVTSVSFMERLLKGELNGNFLMMTELRRAKDQGLGVVVKGVGSGTQLDFGGL